MNRLLLRALAIALFAGLGAITPVAAEMSLYALYTQALQNNPSVQTAKSAVLQQESIHRQARSVLYPSLDATIRQANTEGDATNARQTTEFALGYVVNFESFPALKQSKLSITRARISEADETAALFVAIARAYQTIQLAAERLDLETSSVEYQTVVAERTEQAYAAGTQDKVAYLQATAALADSRARLISAKNQFSEARHALALLIGRAYDEQDALAPLTFADDYPAREATFTWSAVWRDALASNTALTEQATLADMAELEITRRARRRWPVLALSVSQQSITDETEQGALGTVKSDSNNTVTAISATLPIFAGFRTSAEMDEATALRYQQAEQQKQVTNALENQLRTLLLVIDLGYEQIPALRAAVEANRLSLDAVTESNRFGIRTVSDVLNSMQTLKGAQLALREALFQDWISRIELAYLTGTLDTEQYR